MKDPGRGPVLLSTARSVPLVGVGGCGTWGVGDRPGWVGTLLGPEGSAGWLVACGLLRPCLRVMRGWWWLVGLLFEICIVDASIFVAIVVVLCL
jgi:hypothetical protein